MIIVDINLLLYAEIDATPAHASARRWWEDVMNGDRQVGIPPVSLFGFVRISTNRRVFVSPLSIDDALGRVREWLERPHVAFLTPGPRHLEIAFGYLEKLRQCRQLDERRADRRARHRERGRSLLQRPGLRAVSRAQVDEPAFVSQAGAQPPRLRWRIDRRRRGAARPPGHEKARNSLEQVAEARACP